MKDVRQRAVAVASGISKAKTGIPGLDEITFGGLPAGRPTLVCGSAGCGKTLMGLEFIVRGATEFDEPGVFVAFEESARDLTEVLSKVSTTKDRSVLQNPDDEACEAPRGISL